MRRFIIIVGGLLMSVSTFVHYPDILLIPDARAVPTAITKTLPDASNTTTMTEANLGVEVVSAAANITDANGLESGRPEAYGTPTSNTLSLAASVKRGGLADQNASWIYDSYGATPIYVPSGAETVIADTNDADGGYRFPRQLAHSDGSRLIVAERTQGTDGVVAYRKAITASAWSAIAATTIWTTSTAFTATVRACPVLAQVPSDDASLGVVDYLFSLEVTATNTQQIRVDYSTDGGATWTNAGYSSLTFAVAADSYELMDATYDELGGQFVLLVRRLSGGTYTLLTYVSDATFGSSWTALPSASIISNVNQARLAYRCGKQYMALIDTSGNLASYRRTAASSTWEQTEATITGATMALDHLALVVMPNGHHAIYARPSANSNRIYAVFSSDGGETWGRLWNGSTWEYPFDDDTAQWALSDDTGALANGLNINGAIYSGGSVWLSGHLTSAGALDLSVMTLRFGRYITLQDRADGDSSTTEAVFYPANTAATKITPTTFTTAGATTETVTTDAAGHLVDRLSTDNSTGYLTTPTANQCVSAHWIMGASSSGGSSSASDLVLRVTASDTVNYIQVEVRVDATTRKLRFYDVLGAANLSAEVSYSSGAPIELFVSAYYLTGKASAWYKLTTDTAWTALATNQAPTGNPVGPNSKVEIGKLTANTAQVDTLFFRISNDNFSAGTSPEVIGIPAMTSPDYLPSAGIHVAWPDGLLQPGNAWTIRATSETPISFSCPLSVAASPIRKWVGTSGAVGATYRKVYDFGSSYRGKLSRHWIFGSWVGCPAQFVRVRRWTGAAWSTEATGSSLMTSFTAAGTGFARDNAASYTIYPNASNNLPQYWREGLLKGCWAVIGAGADEILGQVLTNGPGQFTTATGALQSWIELDPSTVVTTAGGGLAALATSTTTGSVAIYSPYGAVISDQDTESVRYYAIEIDTLPGTPEAGMLAMGAAYPIARPPRGGSSVRFLTDARLEDHRRVVELPYDQLLVPAGTYDLATASVLNTLSVDGSTPRAAIEQTVGTLLSTLTSAGKRHGNRRGTPIGFIPSAKMSAEPGSSDQSFTHESVIWGYVASSMDVTAGEGILWPRSEDGSQQGTSFILDEAALWLSTVGG